MIILTSYIKHSLKTGLAGMLAIFSVGCATIAPTPTPTQTAASDPGSTRAERVFLYQSRVADSLLDHYPLMEIFLQSDPQLVEAEARMTRACGPLTQAVLAHFAGDEISLGLRFKVFTSIDGCERAAQRIEFLLNRDVPVQALADSI